MISWRSFGDCSMRMVSFRLEMRGSRGNSKIVTGNIRRSGWMTSILWKSKTNAPAASGGRSRSRLGAVDVLPRRSWLRSIATRIFFLKTSRRVTAHCSRTQPSCMLTRRAGLSIWCGLFSRSRFGSSCSESTNTEPHWRRNCQKTCSVAYWSVITRQCTEASRSLRNAGHGTTDFLTTRLSVSSAHCDRRATSQDIRPWRSDPQSDPPDAVAAGQ